MRNVDKVLKVNIFGGTNLNIYHSKNFGCYAISSYLDMKLSCNKNGVYKVTSGTTCKHGSFRRLDKDELRIITEAINGAIKNNRCEVLYE